MITCFGQFFQQKNIGNAMIIFSQSLLYFLITKTPLAKTLVDSHIGP
jgi:hypothetical protein